MSVRTISIEECSILLNTTTQKVLHLIEIGELVVHQFSMRGTILKLDDIIKYMRHSMHSNQTHQNDMYCLGFNESDKLVVSKLLDNCRNKYTEGDVNKKIFSLDEMLWLTAESWRLCKLKKFVSVQTIAYQTASIFYTTHDDNDKIVIKSKPIDSQYIPINVTCLENVKFEHVKHSYSKIIADSIDDYIFNKLYECVKNRVVPISDGYDCNRDADWICGPEKEIDSITYACDMKKRIEIQDMRVVLDSDLNIKVVCGEYPNNKLSPPIFCPFVLVSETPRMEPLGLPSFAMKLGWCDGS